jgi:DNA-binding transcriptional LysR family regulator
VDLRLLRYFAVVAEERHVGRAAVRLHMTQPPLSRAIRQLEDELGVTLFERTRSGVALTRAGEVLQREASAVLEHVELLRTRVQQEADLPTLSVGSLADTAELVGGRLVAAFRERHPHVAVTVHEFDLSDPTAGLRPGLVDVALTRTPFDTAGLSTRVLARQRIGVEMRADDPLAGESSVRVAALADRDWIRLPEAGDAIWLDYWTGPGDGRSAVPPMRTIQECLQAVLWNGMSALAPVGQPLPHGLVSVVAEDRPVNELLLAWRSAQSTPLIRAFVQSVAEAYRGHTARVSP